MSSRTRLASCLVLAVAMGSASADVTLYEGNPLPDDAAPAWERDGTFDADRWLDEGWFYHFVELGVWGPPPIGENDVYRRSIPEYAGEQAFFIQWEVQSGSPPSDIAPDVNGTSCVLAAFGRGNANYHFTVTNGRMRVIRNSHLPVVYVDIQPDVPHTYRLELYWEDLYAWYIDGVLIDSGTPYGEYPRDDSKIIWGSGYYLDEYTTKWNYIRYGTISDTPGDFDADGDWDAQDWARFAEYLAAPHHGPGTPVWRGCLWADMDGDDDVDLLDAARFQSAFTGPK